MELLACFVPRKIHKECKNTHINRRKRKQKQYERPLVVG